jgi:hypothetical protein
LASASRCPRSRIGSWARVTCTSTRGGSYHPPGIVPSQPPGSGPFAPRGVLCDRPIPASAGLGHALAPTPPVRLRAFRRGTRRWGNLDRPPPRGSDVLFVPLGAGACRPSSAPRHGDPVPPSGLGRAQVRDLRTVASGPASAEPTVTLRSFVDVDGFGFGRHLDRRRDAKLQSNGLASAGPSNFDPYVRRPWNDPASVGDLLGPLRPSPGRTMPPHGAPLCGLGRIGLPCRHGKIDRK